MARIQAQSGFTLSGTGVSATFTAPSFDNHFLVAILIVNNNSAVTAPASWSLAATGTNGTNKVYIYYRENAPSVTTINFSVVTPGMLVLLIGEYSDVSASSSLDQVANDSGSSTSPSTGTTPTTSEAVELLIGALGSFGNTGVGPTFSSPTSSFSIAVQEKISDGESTNVGGALLDRIVSSTDTYSTGATQDINQTWAGAIATFKTTDSGPFPAGYQNPQRGMVFYSLPRDDAYLSVLGLPKLSTQGELLGQSTIYRQPDQTSYKEKFFDASPQVHQKRAWPIPVSGPDPSVFPAPNSPRWNEYYRVIREPLPDRSALLLEALRRHNYPIPPVPLFRGLLRQLGRYRIFNQLTVLYEFGKGKYRIANEPVWNIYVGEDTWPDLNTPTVTVSALPTSIVVTPPVAGTTTFYVVTRYQNEYGLESQNQRPYTLTIDSNGDLVLPAIPTPLNLRALPRPNGAIRILAEYPTVGYDAYPADKWYIWIGTPGNQPPFFGSGFFSGDFFSSEFFGAGNGAGATLAQITNVTGSTIVTQIASYVPGTYEVTIALYRTQDGAFSEQVSTLVTIPPVPAAPGDVHTGLEPGW